MDLTQAVIFGITQGLTEYLPISSSAHLLLLPQFFGWEDPGLAFDVFLHLGTLAATVAYFWKDWVDIFKQILCIFTGAKSKKNNLWKNILWGTIPALVLGACFHSWISTALRDVRITVFTLSIGGFLLFAFDYWGRRTKDTTTMPGRDAWLIGFFQSLALIPGMSRSGSTMMGARLLGYARGEAARFSFLLSGPVTFAALVFELRKLPAVVSSVGSWTPLWVGALVAMISGMFAISLLLKVVRRWDFSIFAVYRIVLACLVWWVLVRGPSA